MFFSDQLVEMILKDLSKQNPPVKDIFNPEDSKLYDPEIISLIDSLANEFMMGNTPEVYKFIGELESNNDPTAKSGISEASGVYQFTPEEVKVTKNRAKRTVGFDKDYIIEIPSDPREWTMNQANVMITSYLAPKEIKGKEGFVDELIKRAFKKDYDIEDWIDLYWLHHTNKDKTRFSKQVNKNIERVAPKYTRPNK